MTQQQHTTPHAPGAPGRPGKRRTIRPVWERIECPACLQIVEIANHRHGETETCIHCGTHIYVCVPAAIAPGPAALECGQELRGVLRQMIADSGKSRESIAREMSLYLGASITRHQITAWISPSSTRWRLPAEYIDALEVACGSLDLTRYLAGRRGGRLLHGIEAVYADLGRTAAHRAALQDREARLLAHLAAAEQ